MQGIYAIVNAVNGHRYVGSSMNCEKRFRIHVSALSTGRHVNPKLLAAWRKYGASSFSVVVIEEVARREDLLVREQAWLPSGYYNLAPKADRPPGMTRRFTAEERQRFSDARRGKPKPWLRGKKHSPEHIERAHAPLRGQKRPGVGAKISAATRGQKRPKASLALLGNRRGVGPRSPEARAAIKAALQRPEAQAKLSATWKGRKQSLEHVAKRVAKQLGQKRTPEMREKMRSARLAFLARTSA